MTKKILEILAEVVLISTGLATLAAPCALVYRCAEVVEQSKVDKTINRPAPFVFNEGVPVDGRYLPKKGLATEAYRFGLLGKDYKLKPMKVEGYTLEGRSMIKKVKTAIFNGDKILIAGKDYTYIPDGNHNTLEVECVQDKEGKICNDL